MTTPTTDELLQREIENTRKSIGEPIQTVLSTEEYLALLETIQRDREAFSIAIDFMKNHHSGGFISSCPICLASSELERALAAQESTLSGLLG